MQNPFHSFDLASFNLIRQRAGLPALSALPCPPPVENSEAQVVVTPAKDGQGVGISSRPYYSLF